MEAMKRLRQVPLDKLPSVFIITGEEELLMQRYLTLLVEKVVSPGMQDLNLATYEGKNFTIQGLLEAFETLPVMSDKKLVVVKSPSFLETKGITLTDKEERQLIRFLNQPAPGTCSVFFCTNKPDGRKKVFKAIKEVACAEDFPRLKEAELRQFIKDEIQQAGKAIDGQALKKFTDSFDYFGGSATQTLLDVHQEIQKLLSFMGEDQRIGVKQVEDTTIVAFQNDVFMLIESFAGKRGAETQRRFHQLLSNGEPLIKIIGYLRNQFKIMLKAKELSQQGYTVSKLASKLKQNPYAMKKNLTYSQLFQEEDLVRLLNGFLTINREMKQGKMDPRTAMELLIADLCNS